MSLDLALDHLRTAHLIHPVGELEPTFLFNHVLTQEAAYQSLLVKGRRELHRRVAVAFEQVYADRLEDYVPTLAMHYWRGEDWPKAAEYARRAGETALRVYALREAIAYFAQALQALDRQPDPDSAETCDVLTGWAQAAFGFEPFPKLLEQLERAEKLARRLEDKRRLAMILLLQGRSHLATGRSSLAAPSLMECFQLATELGDDRLAVTPTFAMGMVAVDEDPRHAIELFDHSAKLAHRYGDIDTEANALSMSALMHAWLGQNVACRLRMDQALGMVGQGTSPVSEADVYLASAWATLELGEVPTSLEYAQKSVDKAVANDAMECACLGFAILGMSHLRLEQVDKAILAFEEAVRRSKISGAEEALILGESGLGMARFVEGHPNAIEELENALAHSQSLGKDYVSALIAQTLGDIYGQRGNLDRSISHLEKAAEYYRGHGMRLYLTRTLELLGKVAEAQGDTERASHVRSERDELLQDPTIAA